jgi:hypothetical protein
MAQQSILDARLAEIDRRLRSIQSGLAAGDEPSPPLEPEAAPASPAPALRDELAEAGRLVARLHELTATHERLLASSRELLATFAEALAGAQPRPADQASPADPARSADQAPAADPVGSADQAPTVVGLAAGPFADTTTLRRFQEALSGLPEVRSVTVREYTGSDRVVVDVLLSGPTS